MLKYTTEFKLKIVEHYLQTNCSKKSLARKFGVSRSDVQKWIALYENQGEAGLVSTYTNYDIHFKLDVLNYMSNTGASYTEATAVFRIPSPQTVWKCMDTEGVDALQPKVKGRPTRTKSLRKNYLIVLEIEHYYATRRERICIK